MPEVAIWLDRCIPQLHYSAVLPLVGGLLFGLSSSSPVFAHCFRKSGPCSQKFPGCSQHGSAGDREAGGEGREPAASAARDHPPGCSGPVLFTALTNAPAPPHPGWSKIGPLGSGHSCQLADEPDRQGGRERQTQKQDG